jgi:hypothetical protein
MAVFHVYVRNSDTDPWVERVEVDESTLSLGDTKPILAAIATNLISGGEPQVEVRDNLGIRQYTLKLI